MRVVLKHGVYRIKNGFAAHSQELGLTAHGPSIELAKQNLERTAALFLKPFARQEMLEKELQLLGINFEGDGAELAVITSE